MNQNKQISRSSSKLDELQNLLEKQISFAKQGNLNKVELLNEQAESLAGQISQSGIFEPAEFKTRHKHIRKLYQDLYLALKTQQTEAAEELKRVRKGKKTIAAYRGNI